MYTLKFINVAWIFTFLGFLVVLSLSYASVPEQVAFHTDLQGEPDQFVGKETFFYLALGTFVAVNIICFIFFRLLRAVPTSSPLFYRSELFKDRISAWFSSFTTVINVFIICMVAYISLFNTQGDYHISQFNWIIFVAPVLFGAVVLWLLVLLLSPKPISTEV
uniref:DUF1648 domain-containing protein n=1 Tax=Roseihalotalea indica TaxID=2867963 RepID=A0AA49GIG0_9BACT|nr:DUF1648 domain-containing protein [Tunicatimonas sp. TK19036]